MVTAETVDVTVQTLKEMLSKLEKPNVKAESDSDSDSDSDDDE